MMKIAFAIHKRDRSIIPFIVSLFTWSKAYHCELVFSDGYTVSTDVSHGVYLRYAKYDTYHWVLLPLPWITQSAENSIRNTANKLIENKSGYDLMGAIFGSISKYFNDPNNYFCTELCSSLLQPWTSDFKQSWYNPDEIWKIISNRLDKYSFLVLDQFQK